MKKTANYEYVCCFATYSHILKNLLTGKEEVWFSCKVYEEGAIRYKNTWLTFVVEA